MASNVLNMLDAFKIDSNAEIQERRTRNALNQMQAGEAMRQIRNRNALAEIARAQPDLTKAAEAYQAQTGDVLGAEDLRGRAQKNDLARLQMQASKLEYLANSAKLVNENNYPAWRQSMVQQGLASPQDLPESYDAAVMNALAGRAAEALKEFTLFLPGGKQQQVLFQGNQPVYEGPVTERWKPEEHETWSAPEMVDGQLVQRSSRGKISAVGSSGKSARELAAQLTAEEIKAQAEQMLRPGMEGYRSPTEIFREYLAMFEGKAAPAQGAEPATPAGIFNPADTGGIKVGPDGTFEADLPPVPKPASKAQASAQRQPSEAASRGAQRPHEEQAAEYGPSAEQAKTEKRGVTYGQPEPLQGVEEARGAVANALEAVDRYKSNIRGRDQADFVRKVRAAVKTGTMPTSLKRVASHRTDDELRAWGLTDAEIVALRQR